MHDNRIQFQMRRSFAPLVPFVIVALGAGAVIVGQTQSTIDPKLQSELKQLFPAAAAFSPKVFDPPHYKAYASNPAGSSQAVAGLAFWTTEIEPLERGYDGPIKILVGMNTNGILTGIIVVQHHEPYGDFSIETPQFAAQFRGKSVRDPFRVGADVDAVSRATISITSAARAIRNSARRMATQLLVPPK
jgi:NosR/NirI family transcriptional regulator, nitrous oxide reductase regulator